MKKLLVVLLAAMMVLSVAAVSMAAVNVKGDFRYDMFQDETATDESYANADLRLNFSGAVSDTVDASATFKTVHSKNAPSNDFAIDEFFVNYKQTWGSVKAGYYEYKFTPSRVLLKSGGYHVWPKADVLVATTFNSPVDGLTFDVLVQPYQQNQQDDGAYGVAVDYKADSFGVKLSYADFLMPVSGTDDANLMAIDAYYMISDTMKVFVTAVDYSANEKVGADPVKYDGIDPVIGFSWDKIAGSKFFAAVEYAINPRFEDDENKEFNETTLNLKYQFTNNTGLEIEHYVANADQNKTMYRLRYKF